MQLIKTPEGPQASPVTDQANLWHEKERGKLPSLTHQGQSYSLIATHEMLNYDFLSQTGLFSHVPAKLLIPGPLSCTRLQWL